MALLVTARGALVAKSGVAAGAETRNVARFGFALRTLHWQILSGRTDRWRYDLIDALRSLTCPDVQGVLA